MKLVFSALSYEVAHLKLDQKFTFLGPFDVHNKYQDNLFVGHEKSSVV